MELTKAQAHETPLVLQLIKELAAYEQLEHEVIATEEELHNSLFDDPKGPEVLIARHEGEVVGFVLYFYNFSTFVGKKGIYIEDLYVREAYRSQGFGKQILEHLCQKASIENCGRVEWWVLDWNEKAINFYQKMGAIPMSEWTVFRLDENAMNRLTSKG
ncbi:MAG: hypothetical protein S4CHLAM102_02280 [Chlamydiia bacterium]|nr:hypothetical protein [Chlamydiia bacterium]